MASLTLFAFLALQATPAALACSTVSCLGDTAFHAAVEPGGVCGGMLDRACYGDHGDPGYYCPIYVNNSVIILPVSAACIH